MMRSLVQDLRHTFVVLRKNPKFTVVAVLALTLGIGANTAIFSLVNAVLLRQLAFKAPEQLVWIWSTRTDRDKAFFSIPDFVDYQAQSQSLQEMTAFANWGANLTDGGEPERLIGVRATANVFQMLGVEAAAGRTLMPEDGEPRSQRAVVLSYGLWQRRFGGDRGIVGKNITLNGDSYTVVGALPSDFIFPGAETDIVVPLVLGTDPRRSDRGANFLRVIARLKPGHTREQVQAEMDSISRQLQQLYPATNAKKTPPRVFALHGEVVGGYQTALTMLLGAVGLVLLIACSNLANLQLSRAAARRREFAIRAALGATPRRLIRQQLTETSVLGLLGGAFGLLLAWWGVKFLMTLSPTSLPRANQVGIDWRVLAFTLLISLLAGFIFGLVPALQAAKVDLNKELKGAGKGTGDAGQRNRTRSMIMVSEVAISLVLLVTAGLLVKSFLRLHEVSPGFDGDNLLLVRLSLPPAKYSNREAVTVFFDKTLSEVQNLSGVRGAAVANVLPLSGMNVRNDFTIVGRPPLSAADIPAAQTRWVSPGYFQTMGIQLVSGREFTQHDNSRAPGVVVIDEALAKRYWPNENPVGSHLKIDDGSPKQHEVEVVGVVRNVKHVELDEQPTPTLYGPVHQIPENNVSFLAANCSLAVRTRADALALETPVRRAVQGVDQDVPVSNSRTMDQFLSASMAPRRFNVQLLALFACVALLLAATGVYAVMSYAVTQRTQEMGIRLALGAQAGDVLKLVLGRGFKLVLIGIAIGLVGGLASTRYLSSLLFGVSTADPVVFVLTPFILLLVALSACYIPARKATKVDPVIALRTE